MLQRCRCHDHVMQSKRATGSRRSILQQPCTKSNLMRNVIDSHIEKQGRRSGLFAVTQTCINFSGIQRCCGQVAGDTYQSIKPFKSLWPSAKYINQYRRIQQNFFGSRLHSGLFLASSIFAQRGSFSARSRLTHATEPSAISGWFSSFQAGSFFCRSRKARSRCRRTSVSASCTRNALRPRGPTSSSISAANFSGKTTCALSVPIYTPHTYCDMLKPTPSTR